MKFSFFDKQEPLNMAAQEQTISAWKTQSVKIDDRDCIKIIDGSDGNEEYVGKIFEVLSYHFGGQKIAFNKNQPVEQAKPATSLFDKQGSLNLAAQEQSISAWKTQSVKIDDRDCIKIIDGSDGNKEYVGKTFEVLSYHFGGQKIAFNGNQPVEQTKPTISLTF